MISQMYQQQTNAAIAAISAAIAESKNAIQYTQGQAEKKTEQIKNSIDANYQLGENKFNSIIEDAPAKYDPYRSQSELQRYTGLQTLEEAIANRGDRGGLGRQELLMSDLAGQKNLNSINLAQAQEIKDANRGIADLMVERGRDMNAADIELMSVINQTNRDIAMLESKGMFAQAEAVAKMGAEKIGALINESNRIEEATYNRSQDAKEDTRWQSEFDRQTGRDTASDSQWQSEFDRITSRDTIGDERTEQERADEIAMQMGIIPNPTVGVDVPEDIRAQLKPYEGDYAAFIQGTTDENLKYWANVLRNEKIYGNLGEYGKYGTPTLDATRTQYDITADTRNFNEDVRQFDTRQQEEARQFNASLGLDMRKMDIAEAQQIVDNAFANRQITNDEARTAMAWAEFEAEQDPNSYYNQSRTSTSTEVAEANPEKLQAVEDDLKSMSALDAYLDLVNYSQDYIADIGREAYLKLLADYKKIYDAQQGLE
jgi:hypothetical protein